MRRWPLARLRPPTGSLSICSERAGQRGSALELGRCARRPPPTARRQQGQRHRARARLRPTKTAARTGCGRPQEASRGRERPRECRETRWAEAAYRTAGAVSGTVRSHHTVRPCGAEGHGVNRTGHGLRRAAGHACRYEPHRCVTWFSHVPLLQCLVGYRRSGAPGTLFCTAQFQRYARVISYNNAPCRDLWSGIYGLHDLRHAQTNQASSERWSSQCGKISGWILSVRSARGLLASPQPATCGVSMAQCVHHLTEGRAGTPPPRGWSPGPGNTSQVRARALL